MGKRLLVASPKGGVGKTTTARNLAVAAVMKGLKVAMVDLDEQHTLGQWWADRPDEAPAIDCFQATMEDTEGLLKALAGKDYDLVVFDTPPSIELYPEDMKRLVLAADLVLIPTGVSKDDTRSTAAFMKTVRGLKSRGAFVLSKVNRRTGSFLKGKRALMETGSICPFEIPVYEDFNTVAELGIGILELKGAKGADEIAGVWTFAQAEMAL
ncbi:Chromosome (plasmid) partitioning protein ParA [Azospirillum argentinense]|uniref:ParA family protein n=1 Tax=Azospirillum argentinense TaxID=2970906 RepID=UPI0032DEB081